MNVNQILIKVACVLLILCVVFPLGQMIFPMVADAIDELQFGALEAVLTTSLGFTLYSSLFG
jgi:hypothetical protein